MYASDMPNSFLTVRPDLACRDVVPTFPSLDVVYVLLLIVPKTRDTFEK